MYNRTNGWTAGLLAVTLCALILIFATPGATAQSSGGNGIEQRVAALETIVVDQQAAIDQLTADLAAEQAARISADLQFTEDLVGVSTARIAGDAATLASANAYTDAQFSGQTTRIAALEEKTQFMSVVGTTTFFSGTNVQIINGLGNTETKNSLGNLIVGYNKTDFFSVQTGSHNLVVGDMHSFSSFGGFVAGRNNNIGGKFSTVVGGYRNLAYGERSTVLGGYLNEAYGRFSTVAGGDRNTTSGYAATVSGGTGNTAGNDFSNVSGGQNVSTTLRYQWVGGTHHSP